MTGEEAWKKQNEVREKEMTVDEMRKMMYDRERKDLLDILWYLDDTIYETMKGEKSSVGELKHIIQVSVVSLHQDLKAARKSSVEYRKRVAKLSQLDAFRK
jgi:hypothetical protein